MKIKNKQKIDFVMFWVDGNDLAWRAEREKWEKKLKINQNINIDKSEARYRDWDLLKYWFRGVEQFAPWVNKIHFVTCGHLPEWLNVNHPKLHIVKHSDYMPDDVLPTFNSNAIELSMHKIDGLSEQFVAFNDDFFLLKKVRPVDFFKNGKPCNTMALHALLPYSNISKTGFNNIDIINTHFDFKYSVRSNLTKYFSLKQRKYILKTLPLLVYKKFSGFATFHMPISYLKPTWDEVWKKEHDKLFETMQHRFRDYEKDISHWVFNYWQFANGDFEQRDAKFGINTTVDNPRLPKIILRKKAKCVNIADVDDIANYDSTKRKLVDAFREILPDKSEFEK